MVLSGGVSAVQNVPSCFVYVLNDVRNVWVVSQELHLQPIIDCREQIVLEDPYVSVTLLQVAHLAFFD